MHAEVTDEVTTEKNLNLSQVEKSAANLHDDLKETSWAEESNTPDSYWISIQGPLHFNQY